MSENIMSESDYEKAKEVAASAGQYIAEGGVFAYEAAITHALAIGGVLAVAGTVCLIIAALCGRIVIRYKEYSDTVTIPCVMAMLLLGMFGAMLLGDGIIRIIGYKFTALRNIIHLVQ